MEWFREKYRVGGVYLVFFIEWIVLWFGGVWFVLERDWVW